MGNDEISTDGLVCTIDPDGEATTYIGDNGGPLVVKVGDRFTLLGLVSWGFLDPEVRSYNMFVDVHSNQQWIEETMGRAADDSWVELNTGGSHGIVMVHDKMGKVATVCNDNVGKSEINAVCRGQGYTKGALADVRDYLPGERKQKKQGGSGLPPYGYTNLNCGDDNSDILKQCTMEEYEFALVPCFDGQQLAVKCTDEDWSFEVTNIFPEIKSVKGTEFARGRISCMVHAEKYGIPLDMKSQVKVGLVIRGDDGIEDIEGKPMKYRKKTGMHVGRFKPTNEVLPDACFACIAYLPGEEFYAVGKSGPGECPDNEDHYKDWVRKQNGGSDTDDLP